MPKGERRSPAGLSDGAPGGHHFRWDLDKTYLRTDFDSARDLMRTFLQRPEEKVTVPGAARLLRELLKSHTDEAPRRVSFVSGSPTQMRRVLVQKLRLDGIEPHAFILKPSLRNLLRLRLKALRGQVGYKLGALLASRLTGERLPETLFGDDAEMDAFIYSLYADILANRVDDQTVLEVLDAAQVYPDDHLRIEAHLRTIPRDGDVVGRIFIHLDRRSPPGRFSLYGRRTVPIFNYFQAALLLHADGLLADDSLLAVIGAMGEDGYGVNALANSLQDLMRRGFATPAMVACLERAIQEHEHLLAEPAERYIGTFGRVVSTLERLDRHGPPAHPPIDYVLLAYGRRYRPLRLPLPKFPWLG
jgi:hypothetical protein